MRTCKKCGKEKPLVKFVSNSHCREGRTHVCYACKYRSDRERRGYDEYRRKVRFQYRYGLTLEDYESMLERQDGVCAICKLPPTGSRKEDSVLHVDHCHDPGAVRGLLCSACNKAIGLLRDKPELLRCAAEYLETSHAHC